MTSTDLSSDISAAAAATDEALRRLEGLLERAGDGDLHLGSPSGGWSVAQIVSHISLSALLWVADVERVRRDPDLDFLFREEVGHDALGYPPPTTENAVRRLRSTRRLLASCLPALEPEVLGRTVEIPDLGRRTVGEWTPPILGHLDGHVEQAVEVLRSRDALPAGA